MKNIILLSFFILIYSLNLFSQPKEIVWKEIGQKYEIKKGEDFFFIYDKNLPKTSCLYIDAKEKPETIVFEIKTNCVKAPDSIYVPDVILVGCDGEISREFNEQAVKGSYNLSDIIERSKAKFERNIIWREIGQSEILKFCELVTFIYTDYLPKEDIDFVYETIDEGYKLTLVQKGFKQTLNFDCICKKYMVSNPEAINIRVNKFLVYEQVIWTPIDKSFWEVRIGTTNERGCNSPARNSLKLKRLKDKNYEKNIPKCNN